MTWNRLKYFIIVILCIASCSHTPGGIIIFCAGDSITEIAYPQYLQKIYNKVGIQAEVLNYGRGGYTSGEYLKFLKKNMKTLAAEKPDFVLLQLGTNDVRVDHDSTPGDKFYSSMKKIIKIFKRFRNRAGEKTRILLASIPPIPEGNPFPFTDESATRVIEEINPLIERISAEEKIYLVDNYSLFLRSPHLLPEVHPTWEGYEYLALNWFNHLIPMLPLHLKKAFRRK
ncbi:MAG: SGNH/GDSL hydrolase family protein [Candidatus Aminicenantaceae bacterium]